MRLISRRRLLLATTVLAGLALAAGPVLAVNLAELNKAPDLGEMALGPEDAKVTIIEYASATCPHCAAFHTGTYKQLKAEYIDTGKVRFVFREFATNDAALAAFMVARAVPKDAYFHLMDVYFETLGTWTQGNWADGLFNIAKQAGMTREKFDATMKDEALARAIIAIGEKGQEFGVRGTPSFFINGEMYEGDRTLEGFKARIDPLLN
jgi:protein-disulfide isomerase